MDGQTAADMAMQANHPMVFAFLDPEGAEKKGKELLQKMDTAKRVHVISTRYQKEESMMEQDKGKKIWAAIVRSVQVGPPREVFISSERRRHRLRLRPQRRQCLFDGRQLEERECHLAAELAEGVGSARKRRAAASSRSSCPVARM